MIVIKTEVGASSDLIRQIADVLHGSDRDKTPGAVLERLVAVAVRDVPGADHAGVTVLDRHDLTSEASTDELVRRLDQRQHELGEGPCVEAAREQRTFRIDDTSAETRWPQFIPAAVDMGIGSMLSVELFAGDSISAALNLYATRPHQFTAESEDLAVMLAAPAGLAVSAARKIENLTVALESRDLIGQAKGILMERYKINGQEAFDLLVVASQRSNRKLREIADELASTGELHIPEG